MAEDPRKFLADACGPVGNPALAPTRKSEFFRNVGKVGDLEVLNEVNNEIGQGLRALETISNQIRLGEGAPRVFSDPDTSQTAGEDAVMEQVQIDPNQARGDGVRFNPGVANRAFGQANAIYERVRQGNFEVRDVPEAIQDFGNLSQLLGGIFTPIQGENAKSEQRCDPSPYARDLIALAPKHKFMFVVEFVFNLQFQPLFSQLDFAFVIKRSTRPVIQFDYEDVNFYNFRSKVLRRSEYQPMTMTFYDDMLDNALQFYNTYLQLISPISRTIGDGDQSFFEEAGMTFDPTGPNSASVQAIGDTTKTIINYANIYHIIHGGKEVDVYRFDNPRLQTLTLDDLDMVDGSSGTEVTVEFNYDGLLIEPKRPIEELASNLKDLTSGGIFPLAPRLSGNTETVKTPGVDLSVAGPGNEPGSIDIDATVDSPLNPTQSIPTGDFGVGFA